jgi:hypothetical protein
MWFWFLELFPQGTDFQSRQTETTGQPVVSYESTDEAADYFL